MWTPAGQAAVIRMLQPDGTVFWVRKLALETEDGRLQFLRTIVRTNLFEANPFIQEPIS